MQFFKMPNKLILDQNLHYSAKKIGAKLYSLQGFSKKISIQTIGNKSHAAEGTVYRALTALEAGGYLTRMKSYLFDGALARVVWGKNSYACTLATSRDYTMVPTAIFSRRLTFGAFTLYCYLCMQKGKSSHAFPSYTRITRDIGLSESSVQRCVKRLVAVGLIHVEQCVKKNKSFACNSYFVIQNADLDSDCKGAKTAKQPISSAVNLAIDTFIKSCNGSDPSGIERAAKGQISFSVEGKQKVKLYVQFDKGLHLSEVSLTHRLGDELGLSL